MALRVLGGMEVSVWGDQEKRTSPRSRMRVVAFVKDITMYQGEEEEEAGGDGADGENERKS